VLWIAQFAQRFAYTGLSPHSRNISARDLVPYCSVPEVGVRVLALFAASAVLSVSSLSGSTQTKVERKDLQNHPFAVECPSGSRLRLHLRSGDFRIVGRQDNRISVRLEGRNAINAQDLTVRLGHHADGAEVYIFGGPRDGLEVTIEVPASSMLYVRMPAGDLTVEGVSGDKDVELRAGDLSIAVGNAADYGRVDASVIAGDLEASPFNESHGGLFRSFEKRGAGKYTLHAHVGAGDLTLR
jgi:hypothetical protein